MSDNNIDLCDIRRIWDQWNRFENMDRLIFPEDFTDDLEIIEQIYFYRLIFNINKNKKVIFNGKLNPSNSFYASLVYGLNTYTEAVHRLHSLVPFDALKLRNMAADYFQQNKTEFEEFDKDFISDPELGQKIRNNELWTGDIEIASIAEALKLNIQVYVFDSEENAIFCKVYGEFIDEDIPAISVGFRPIANSYDSILHLGVRL